MSVCPTRCPATRENDKHIGSEDSLPSGVLLPFCGTFSKRSMFSILYPVLRRVSTCDTLKYTEEINGPPIPSRDVGDRFFNRGAQEVCNMSGDFNYIPFSETYDRRKLNSLYREIPLKDTESRLLRKYFNAASNLYGIIPLGKLYEIISSQSRRPMSEDVFRAFAEIAKHECEDYCILGDVDLYTDGRPTDLMDYEVIDVTLIFDDPDDYLSLKQIQHGKPYYVPKRAEFLCYADPFYFEQSKEAAALRDFLVTGMSLEPGKADVLMVDIGYDARCGTSIFKRLWSGLRNWA